MSSFTPLSWLLASLLLVAACSDSTPIAGEIDLQDNDFFSAEFDLVDMYGEPASDERFEGKPMLIYFGFTSCPDVCPAALGVMVATLDAMGRDAERLQPLFITVDPERDTPEALKAHLAFDPRILGLTGTEAQTEEARDNMRLFASVVPLKDSAARYTVDHQSMFFLVDANGEVIRGFDDMTPPVELAKRLKTFL